MIIIFNHHNVEACFRNPEKTLLRILCAPIILSQKRLGVSLLIDEFGTQEFLSNYSISHQMIDVLFLILRENSHTLK